MTLPEPEASRDARRVRVVDSHTEGEATRVVLDGGPELGNGPIAERRDRLRAGHDHFRRGLVTEPRGTASMVGALLLRPADPSHAAGVVFFDAAGYLGMCGHGTIGVVTTLAHLGRFDPGPATLETPVGPVETELTSDGSVSFANVPSYRSRAAVSVDVPGVGVVVGDVAWGGNWFFVTERAPAPLRLDRATELTDYCRRIRDALARDRVTGEGGEPIEHVELCGPPVRSENDGRNFVLCPSGTYDRSPCGTGTSARMACLAAEGRLAPGAVWRQEGILGGVFEGRAERLARGIRPRITGRAHITGESTLVFDAADPLRDGIGA